MNTSAPGCQKGFGIVGFILSARFFAGTRAGSIIMLKHFSNSLISKYILRTGLVLLVTISLFAFFNISTLKEIFLQDAKDDIETVSEIILHTTHFQMLKDNRPQVYDMIKEVCSHEKIDRIRLFSTSGLVHFSTSEEEIGKRVEEINTPCEDCDSDVVSPLESPPG